MFAVSFHLTAVYVTAFNQFTCRIVEIGHHISVRKCGLGQSYQWIIDVGCDRRTFQAVAKSVNSRHCRSLAVGETGWDCTAHSLNNILISTAFYHSNQIASLVSPEQDLLRAVTTNNVNRVAV